MKTHRQFTPLPPPFPPTLATDWCRGVYDEHTGLFFGFDTSSLFACDPATGDQTIFASGNGVRGAFVDESRNELVVVHYSDPNVVDDLFIYTFALEDVFSPGGSFVGTDWEKEGWRVWGGGPVSGQDGVVRLGD